MAATLRANITPATTADASFLQSKECLMRNAQRDIGANNKNTMDILNIFKRKAKAQSFNYEQDTRSKLVLAFEHDGHKYYRFPNELSLPFQRFTNSMALLERLSSGTSGSEMDLILDVMEKALSKGLSIPKNAAVVATCIHALRERQQTIIHKDLLLNIAAVFTVRDDESATGELNQKIHEQKITVFEMLAEKEGEHGFFISLSIERLKPLLSMSQEDFSELWKHNSVQMQVLKEQMGVLTSRLNSKH
jgi:hypothetical protein